MAAVAIARFVYGYTSAIQGGFPMPLLNYGQRDNAKFRQQLSTIGCLLFTIPFAIALIDWNRGDLTLPEQFERVSAALPEIQAVWLAALPLAFVCFCMLALSAIFSSDTTMRDRTFIKWLFRGTFLAITPVAVAITDRFRDQVFGTVGERLPIPGQVPYEAYWLLAVPLGALCLLWKRQNLLNAAYALADVNPGGVTNTMMESILRLTPREAWSLAKRLRRKSAAHFNEDPAQGGIAYPDVGNFKLHITAPANRKSWLRRGALAAVGLWVLYNARDWFGSA